MKLRHATVALLLLTTLTLPLSAQARRYDPEFEVRTTSHHANAHPKMSVYLNGFPTKLSRMTLKLPAGMVGNPTATAHRCSQEEFMMIGRVAPDPTAAGVAADDLPLAGSRSYHGECPAGSKVGTFSLLGSGDRLTAHVRRAFRRACKRVRVLGIPIPGGGIVCDVLVEGFNYSVVSGLLDEDVVNNLTGNIYNCDVFGRVNRGAKAQFCFELNAIPPGAVSGDVNFTRQATEAVTGLDVPYKWVHFVCSADIRSDDFGVNADCRVPKQFMWMPEKAVIRFEGATGAERHRHLLTNPSSCITEDDYREWVEQPGPPGLVSKILRADFYDNGDLQGEYTSTFPGGELAPYTVDHCRQTIFRPSLRLNLSGDSRYPRITINIAQQYGEAPQKATHLTLDPIFRVSDNPIDGCPEAAPSCPNSSKIGEVVASSPMLEEDEPLSGDVFLVANEAPRDRPFQIRMDLHGLIDLRVICDVRVVRGRITTECGGLPPIALSDLELVLDGGRDRGLVEIGDDNYCGEGEAQGAFTDHNDRRWVASYMLVFDNCVGGDVDGDVTPLGRLLQSAAARNRFEVNPPPGENTPNIPAGNSARQLSAELPPQNEASCRRQISGETICQGR